MIRKRVVRNSDEAEMLKLPRTIRLDPSDTFVFESAANPGEWAVSGAFVFWNRDPETLSQKQRVALRSGFLGIDSFGWSTLAIVTEATEAERQVMVERLKYAIHDFTRRQLTWFRKDTRIVWIEGNDVERAEGLVEGFLAS